MDLYSEIDAHEGIEIINVFSYLRLILHGRGLMEYREDSESVGSDRLYDALNTAEDYVRSRIYQAEKIGARG